MYGFPAELDFSPMVGELATQVRVGQFDLQFAFGDFRFVLCSPVELRKDGELIGSWDAVSWPEPAFYDVMNSAVVAVDMPDAKSMSISLENGVSIHLADDSDQFETMQIIVGNDPRATYIV